MTNQIELLERNPERTPEQQAALAMHEGLILHRQMVEVGLVSMCQDLKQIRDNKYYAVLGYETFGEYTEREHGIKQRQAYKYIQVLENLGVEVLHSSAKIGVTKLLEIASLGAEERNNLLAEHSADELEAMSVDEVKRLTEENRKLREQLSFLEEQAAEQTEVEPKPLEELEAEIREKLSDDFVAEYGDKLMELERQLEEAKAAGPSEKELEAARIAAEKAAKAESAAELKKLKDELKAKKDAEAAAAKRAEEAEKKAKENAEAAARAAELEAKVKTAEAEKEAIEKKIKLSADPEMTRFKFLFESWQDSTQALMSQFKKLSDEQRDKARSAIDYAKGVWGL